MTIVKSITSPIHQGSLPADASLYFVEPHRLGNTKGVAGRSLDPPSPSCLLHLQAGPGARQARLRGKGMASWAGRESERLQANK